MIILSDGKRKEDMRTPQKNCLGLALPFIKLHLSIEGYRPVPCEEEGAMMRKAHLYIHVEI